MQPNHRRRLAISIPLALAAFTVAGFLIFHLFTTGPRVAPDPAGAGPQTRQEPAGGESEGQSGAVAAAPGAEEAAASGAEADAAKVEPAPLGPPSLEGRVRDPAKQGIPGARVFAVAVDDWEGLLSDNQDRFESANDPRRAFELMKEVYQEQIGRVAKTSSDEEGVFRLHGLKPGGYRLFTAHEDYLSTPELWVEIEEERTASVEIILPRGYSIAGVVVDAAGEPVEGAELEASPSLKNQQRGIGRFMSQFMEIIDGRRLLKGDAVRSAKDGSFRLRPLEPVLYDVRARKENHAEGSLTRIPAGADGLVVVLPEGKAIRARVVDPDKKPLAAAWTLRFALPKGGIDNPMMAMQGDFDMLGEHTREGKTDDAGRLEIRGLAPRAYDLEVVAAGFPALALQVAVGEDGEDLGELVVEKGLAIAGRVVDADGRPLEKVRVSAPPPAGSDGAVRAFGGAPRDLAKAVSDADGKFSLSPLAAGSYSVHAERDGFAKAVLEKVEAGAADLEISLSAGESLSGRVVEDDSSEPVAGARVRVMGAASASAKTDADGVFEVAGLSFPSGANNDASNLYVQVRSPGYEPAFNAVTRPKENDPPLEFRLRKLAALRGVVLSPENQPVARARVRVEVPGMPEIILMFEGGGGAKRVYTGADGAFELPAVSTSMGVEGMKPEIVASHPAYASGRIAIELLKKAEGGYAEAEIVLQAGHSISGKIAGPTGEAVAGAQVQLTRGMSSLSRDAIMMAMMLPSSPLQTVHSDAEGRYALERVEPGTYILDVAAIGYAGKKLGGVVVGDGPVEKDIALEAGGVIEGLVKDDAGQPAAGAQVLAFLDLEVPFPEREVAEFRMMRNLAGNGVSQSRADAEGRYRLTHLPEGEFSIVARADGYVPAEAPGVKAGARVPDLVLERLAALRVLVRDGRSQQPVPSYHLEIQRVHVEGERGMPFDSWIPPQNVESPEGEYLRENLRPAAYAINVTADGYGEADKTVELRPGIDNEVVVPLFPGFRVEVAALDSAERSPIAGVNVSRYALDAEGNTRSRSYIGRSAERVTGEDGLAVLDTLGEGRYRIQAYHDYYYGDDASFRDVELPRDDGQRIELVMKAAGKVTGTLQGAPEPDLERVQHILVLRSVEPSGEAAAEIRKSSARKESGQPPPPAQEFQIWVDPRRGQFQHGSLPPGQYRIFFKRSVLQVTEDGGRMYAEDGAEPIEIGSVEVRPHQTEELRLRRP
jgi:protocatechuate 3,4-dioxygenase beta subunit